MAARLKGTGMEQDIGAYIRRQFAVEEHPVNDYSPLVLAYIGDAVYELILRTIVISKGNQQVNKLHRETSRYAKAQAQAAMMDTLFPMLTEEEADIYRRGRNAKSHTISKNATVGDYRKATGFEALVGFLYLSGNMSRIIELVKEAVAHYTPGERQGTEARNWYENN